MENWKRVLLSPNDCLVDAVAILEREAVTGIVVVVGESGELLGTITDGDIRRALISRKEMSSPLKSFMNVDPVVALVGSDSAQILALCEKGNVTTLPLLDQGKKVVGVETAVHGNELNILENRVVIMAGGFGRRLEPITNDLPKPLVPVGGKPILERLFEQLVDLGFRNFYLATHYKAEMIEEYFGDGSRWGARIEYLKEISPLGTAGSLGSLPSDLPDLPLIIMNCDLLTKANFRQLIDFHMAEKAVATVCVREYDIQVPYGVVDIDGYKLRSIVEKPINKFFVNAGIYVIENNLLSLLEKNMSADMPELLNICLKENMHVAVFPIHEYWLDIGAVTELTVARQEVEKNSRDWN